jgi:UPF0271 protein
VATTDTAGRGTIDLNADVGESFGSWSMGDDEGLIPLVSSVNIACGAHAGDPATIARTVRLALAHGAAIGAHPGYPDLAGFGRRDLDMAADDLEASLIVQIGAVQAVARSQGASVTHVKPHGALYNRAAREAGLAATIATAIARLDTGLVLVGLAGSALLDAARAAGLTVRAEGFADRAYEPDGSLRDRRLAGAVLDSTAAAKQAVSLARDGLVSTGDWTSIPIDADTLCIHGDGPGAVATAVAVRSALAAAGVDVRHR